MGFVGGGGALRRGQHFSDKSIIYRRRNTPYGVFGKRRNPFQYIFGRACDAVEKWGALSDSWNIRVTHRPLEFNFGLNSHIY